MIANHIYQLKFTMKLIEYLDIESIFKHVKFNQLECFPTAQDYISELESMNEPTHYVEEMYRYLLNPTEGAEIDVSDPSDLDLIKLENNQFVLEWSIGGNESNEGGDNYWGYGWVFTINLEDELFVDFSFENYS